MKTRKNSRRAGAQPKTSRSNAKSRKRKSSSPHASEEAKKYASMTETLKLYKPLKKPITVRVDADVLAWFKKDGSRYQTRINAALRKVMEREMKAAG